MLKIISEGEEMIPIANCVEYIFDDDIKIGIDQNLVECILTLT